MKQLEKLKTKLSELFQLDQPDLDFGFYRIMHAKSKQVQDFIHKDLLKIVADAFGEADTAKKAELEGKLAQALEQAKKFGAPDPEQTDGVKEARAAYNAVKDTGSAETEIYDHLYRFFERYYDNGDFISRRYYTRETAGKAAPFAVPYNGEEVKLHWANSDQYYIKTAEYFNNFQFDATQSPEVRKMTPEERVLNNIPTIPANVAFRVVDAKEGEHGNVKASEATKRFFIIHAEKPLELTAEGELVVNFEYRSDPDKTSQEGPWREKRNAEAVQTIIKTLEAAGKSNKTAAAYHQLLSMPAPTDKDKKRPVLARYINQYTARNTMDYFIHKDLGGFLRRELDFYIKNEVMHLDDIESSEAPAVNTYLNKIRVLRKIASKLIDFLAQLEDFQKKLWLKKKFVLETNYCITLDRVDEKFYPEIAINAQQHDAWVKLFHITEIKKDLVTPGYTNPLTVEFLKANKNLLLDTQFFPPEFKAKLVASIDGFDEKLDGLLVHSENFQALNLLEERYREQIKCVYIDPPYNAKSSEIVYKNGYKDSSWISLMQDRLLAASKMQSPGNDYVTVAIDENEQECLGLLLKALHPNQLHTCVSVIHNPGGIQGDNFSYSHEYAIFVYPDKKEAIGKVIREEANEVPLRDWGGEESKRETSANCFYPILVKDLKVVGFGEQCEDDFHPKANIKRGDGTIEVYPVDSNGVERKWRNADDTVEEIAEELFCKDDKGIISIHRKKTVYRYKTVWLDKRYNANAYGSKLLKNVLGGVKKFDFPKSLYTVSDSIYSVTQNVETPIILDFFAGSGTTGHACLDLERSNLGKRKFVLIEMGEHFETVLKPRLQKVIYSKDWKDGKPKTRNSGISHCFKYLRLESYEDVLNNLEFDANSKRDEAVNKSKELKEDYNLHYLLDVETRGSKSLLNIDGFSSPLAYTVKTKKTGSNEYIDSNVDLLETFNYLIGLRVTHIAEPQKVAAQFKRVTDPELPKDQHTKLLVDGGIKQDAAGPWWFRKIEGWTPKNLFNPNNGEQEKVLIVWRNLTGDLEKDNAVLDEWFQKNRINTRDFEFDTVYVNGSNNLPNLAKEGDTWKVRLIEEDFSKNMWGAGE